MPPRHGPDPAPRAARGRARRPAGHAGSVGYGSYLAGVDVLGLAAPDDDTQMNALLPRQRDLIDG